MIRKILLIVFVLILPLQVWATTYYIDENGDDEDDGSVESPWATLSHACGEVSGSTDVIHVNAGTYTDNTECTLALGVDIEGAGKSSVTINTTASTYIKAYSNATGPCVDGSNEISGIKIDGGDSASIGIRSYGRNNQTIHDCEFEDFTSSGIAAFGRHGVEGAGDFVIMECSAPATACSYCGNDYALNEPPGTNDWGTGIEIYNNTLTDSKLFISALSGALIHDNTIDNSGSTRAGIGHTGVWFKGCKIYNNTITLSDTNTSLFAVELWELSDGCEIYNNISNGAISIDTSTEGKGSSSYVLSFYNNTISSDLEATGTLAAALEITSWISDVEIYGNYIRGPQAFDRGLSIWGRWSVSNITVRNNVFYDIKGDMIFIQTYQHQEDPADPTNIDDIYIYNNVFEKAADGTSQAVTLHQEDADGAIDGVLIKNNIILDCDNVLVLAGPGWGEHTIGDNTDNELKYNYYYDSSLVYNYGTGGYSASNNTNANPQLNYAGSRPLPYYRPLSGSANIVNAGVDVGLAYEGDAPDIGAYEYDDSNPPTAQGITTIGVHF